MHVFGGERAQGEGFASLDPRTCTIEREVDHSGSIHAQRNGILVSGLTRCRVRANFHATDHQSAAAFQGEIKKLYIAIRKAYTDQTVRSEARVDRAIHRYLDHKTEAWHPSIGRYASEQQPTAIGT
jgi:hypothetical protein